MTPEMDPKWSPQLPLINVRLLLLLLLLLLLQLLLGRDREMHQTYTTSTTVYNNYQGGIERGRVEA